MKKIITMNRKAISTLLAAVMMMGIVFTALFSGGVKANAETSETQYAIDFSGGSITGNKFYTVKSGGTKEGLSVKDGDITYTAGLKIASDTEISFTPSVDGKVEIKGAGQKGKKDCAISVGGTSYSVVSIDTNGITTLDDISVKAGKEIIIKKGKRETYIFSVVFTPDSSSEDTKTTHKVTVIDSESTDAMVKTGKVIEKTEGETLELSAEGDNFAYWENSDGYIVSREKNVSFPVYFADTYTAVYKSDVTIEYLTPYGQTYKEFSSVDAIREVEGPTRYGYEFVKWSKDLEAIKAEIKAGKTNVVVKPIYTEASETFGIEIVLDGTSQGVVEYQINTVVSADASNIDNFAYWEDGNGIKLSYNAKYSFYANKDMVVKAVTSTTAVKSDVIIRTVKEPITFGGDKVVMFEFNVPQGAEIKFAGVIADTNQNSLTFANAKYKRGGSVSLGILTYKYTLTKTSTMTDTLYVKPIIRYTIDGQEYEKIGTMVEL